MIAVVHGLAVEMVLEQMDPAQVFLRGDLGLPLERREGLRDEERCGQVDGEAPLLVAGVLLPGLDDLPDQLRDAQHVLVGLRGQAQHEIELHIVPAAGEGRGAGGQNLFLGDVFIDGVPEPLGSGLRREGQAAFPHPLDLQHQVPGEVIRPEGRQRQVDLPRLAVVQQLVRQGLQLLVVRGGEAGQVDLMVAGIFQGIHRLLVQGFRIPGPHRPVAEARLAEAAAADAAPEHLQVGPVVDNLRGGHDGVHGIIGLVQVFDDPLGDPRRGSMKGHDGGEAAVRAILVLIEGRHIDAGDFGNLQQELLLGPVRRFGPVIEA